MNSNSAEGPGVENSLKTARKPEQVAEQEKRALGPKQDSKSRTGQRECRKPLGCKTDIGECREQNQIVANPETENRP